MSCDVNFLEIAVPVRGPEDVERFYAPLLEALGFSPSEIVPGLSSFTSKSQRSRLVLVDTAGKSRIGSRHDIPRADRLILTADSIGQVDRAHGLLKDIGASILVDPIRYAVCGKEYGIVFTLADPGSLILELKYLGTDPHFTIKSRCSF